uniref:Beta-microseminoprotein n=1 Tax=Pinctada fucata TaxID=50426 RepID=A0A194AMW3_PINFU
MLFPNLLFVAVLLKVIACDTSCRTFKAIPTENRPNVCEYRELYMNNGSTVTFNDDCEQCTCLENSNIKCCRTSSGIFRYTGTVPQKCKIITDGCFERVVYNHDETFPCHG